MISSAANCSRRRCPNGSNTRSGAQRDTIIDFHHLERDRIDLRLLAQDTMRKLSAQTPSVFDVAPTALRHFGLPVPADWRGQALF